MATIPVVAIIGRANVGKSSLFNRLTVTTHAVTDDNPGTTRDANYGAVTWNGREFLLADTAGLHRAAGELDISVQEQIAEVASSADIIIVATDAGTIITPEDAQAAQLAHKTGKPVMLAAGKIDATKGQPVDDLRALGIPAVFYVSAVHGTGTGDLLDHIVSVLPVKASKLENEGATLAFVGRPNVGKSSLVNALVGKQTAHVSPLAGTTRDANRFGVKYHTEQLWLTDTAGLRRRGKIEPGVEKFSSLRTLRAIGNADICAVVIDAGEPFAAGDQHVAGMVLEAGKGLILVVNKWDLVEKDDHTQAKFIRRLMNEYSFAAWAPVLFTSAESGLNITKLFELLTSIHQNRSRTITTGVLNRAVTKLVAEHPPSGLKNRRPSVNYATQTASHPPTFTLFCKNADFIHFSYIRYLEKGIRELDNFDGTPIKIITRDKRA